MHFDDKILNTLF